MTAAKLGYCIGQINRFEMAMNWYRLEREYMNIDTSIPIVGATPQETGGPAIAKNPEDPFNNEVRERELEAINEIAAQEPKREIFLETEKEANPLYPLDTVKEEAKILQMMQPDIHAATVSGLNNVIDWSSSSDEEDLISFDLPPGSQPKVSRPKGQAVEVAAVDPNDIGEDGQIKLILTSKRKSHNKMTAALSAATPKVKSKAMPMQAASSSDQASVAGTSKTQPGEIRGPEIIPKAKAVSKAAGKFGETRGQAAEPKREWIKCSGIKIPQIQNYGRRTFLSKKVSYLVRGHAHEHATRSIPEINLKDNSFDYAAVAKWIQRRYDWNCTQYTLLQATSTSNRFEVYVEYAPAGQQWTGLSFMPLRIRAFTGHNDWVTEASGFDEIPLQWMSITPLSTQRRVCDRASAKISRTHAERRCPKSPTTRATCRISLTSSTWASFRAEWETGNPRVVTP